MNKYIKSNKQNNINHKKYFTKEELLFAKQFPRLHPVCVTIQIPRTSIKRVYKRVIKYHTISKDKFQTSIRMVIIHINDGVPFKEGSMAKYYYDLYTKLGIMFADTSENVKLRLIRKEK